MKPELINQIVKTYLEKVELENAHFFPSSKGSIPMIETFSITSKQLAKLSGILRPFGLCYQVQANLKLNKKGIPVIGIYIRQSK